MSFIKMKPSVIKASAVTHPEKSKIGKSSSNECELMTESNKEILHKSNSDPVQGSITIDSDVPNWLVNTVKRRGSPVSKCTLNLDGYSYVIVASPPEKTCRPVVQPQVDDAPSQSSKNGQLSKQSSLTILRRSSSKSLSGRSSKFSYADDEYLDSIDLEEDNLPAIDSTEATERAALRLRVLLRKLNQGEIPATALQKNLRYAAEVLESSLGHDSTTPIGASQEAALTIILDNEAQTVPPIPKAGLAGTSRTHRKTGEDEDELSEVEPDAVPPEVREWLASTFTKQLQNARRKGQEKPKFRSVANAIRAGIFVERIYRRLSPPTTLKLPFEVTSALKRVDEWEFDVWKLQQVSSNTPLRCLTYEFLSRYGLLHKFKIPPNAVEAFAVQIEEGYCKYKNPYHNNVHAADVLQTIHFMLYKTGLMNWLSDVEIFATLVAALIHDFEHTGTTNNFHVMSGTETALLYNDRAVLENYHIFAAFRLLRGDETNILTNLSREEFREFRTLTIDMVLATDMSSHFQQIKSMKHMLTLPDSGLDKSKALSLVLHCCDISHPSKEWAIHERWTKHLLEEFFLQGDKEHELGLPYSPLCDRNNTLVAESQIGFIEFIVEPSLAVCGDLLEKIATINSTVNQTIAEEPSDHRSSSARKAQHIARPWQEYLSINKLKWKERATRESLDRQDAFLDEE